MKDFIGWSQYVVWINQDGSGPTPPVPGPMDFSFDDEGLTEASVTYALANPTATLGMAYSYTEDAHVPYATHGGEALELVYVRKNAVQKKAAALFLGNGLTTEEAELVFGVDVGTFGPAVGRINDEYETPKKAVYSGGVIGEGTTTKSVQVTGFTGTGFMKAVYAGGGNGRVYNVTPVGNELLYVGAGLAGDKIVLDLTEMVTSTPENFVRTETRAEHLDVSTQDSLNSDIPGVVGMAVGFKFNLEIETDQYFRYSARTSNSQFIRNLKGPYTGEIKDAILLSETALPIRIGFYGQYAWAIENVEIWPAAKHIHGAFGKNDAINNNDIVQFRINPSSPYAVAAMVLQDYTAQEYLDDLGIPELNVGGNYEEDIYWKPSNPADPTSAPVFTTAEDHFSAFARAGTKWALNENGIYVEYGANVPAFRWENGKRRYLNEGASTRITPYPATPLTNWTGDSVTVSGYAGIFMGVFSNAAEVFSTGGQRNRILTSATYSLVSGTPISWTAIYRAGSSGRCRITLRNSSSATETLISGVVGSLSVTNTAAGEASITAQYQSMDGCYVVEGALTPNANGSAINIGIGPESASGLSVVAVAGWFETSPFPTSPIFSSPTTSATRPADNFLLSPAHEAVIQSAAVTGLVRGGNVKNLAAAYFLGGATASPRLLGGNSGGTSVVMGNTDTISLATASAPIAEFGISGSWNASGKAGSFNGAATVSNAVGLDTALTQIYLGRSQSAGIMNFSASLSAAGPLKLSNTRLEEIANLSGVGFLNYDGAPLNYDGDGMGYDL